MFKHYNNNMDERNVSGSETKEQTMNKREIEVRSEEDGFRVVSTDGTEYWDIDGPFDTEEEAEKAAEMHKKEWLQSHPDDE